MAQAGVTEIFTNRGPISTGLVLMKGGFFLFGLWVLWQVVTRGLGGETLLVGLVCVVSAGGFGAYDLMQWLKRDKQLTISPEGLIDHRQNPARKIGWGEVGSIGYSGGDSGGWSLLLFPPGDDKHSVRLDGTYLNIGPRELVRLIQAHAPQATIHRAYKLYIG